MTDLSKLPWDELKLPEFLDIKTFASKTKDGNCAVISCYFVGGPISLARQNGNRANRWNLCDSFTPSEIEQIAKMCRMVEEFIERHGGQNG